MNCKFCEHLCKDHVGPTGIPYVYCDKHNEAIVKYMPAGDIWLTTVIGFKYKDSYFHACFFDNNPNIKEKFRIDKIINAYYPTQYAESIISLDFQPDITPENVSEKLSKYLSFL